MWLALFSGSSCALAATVHCRVNFCNRFQATGGEVSRIDLSSEEAAWFRCLEGCPRASQNCSSATGLFDVPEDVP